MLKLFEIQKARAKDKPYKLSDGAGLHLLVETNGRKLWRFRYQFDGKEKMISFGSFPEVSLVDARGKRDEARKLLEAGTDPSRKKQLDRIAAANADKNTFGVIAEEHLQNLQEGGAAETTMSKNRWMLQKARGPLTNRRSRRSPPLKSSIYSSASRRAADGKRQGKSVARSAACFVSPCQTLRATNDPTFPLRGALLKPKVQHRPAITDEAKARRVIVRRSTNTTAGRQSAAALQLIVLTMTRPGDIRPHAPFRDRWPKGPLAHSRRTR